jgi:hypothetical protein
MTVDEALNIPRNLWDQDDKFVDKVIKDDDSTVASCLENSGNHVKSDEFNISDIDLSLYERRLLAIGYMVGCEITKHRVQNDPRVMMNLIQSFKKMFD